MQIGPAFRRFGSQFALIALLVAGCSLDGEATSTPTTSEAPPTEGADNEPNAGESDDNLPEPDVAQPQEATRQPAGDIASLAELSGLITYRDDSGAIVVSSPTGESFVTLNDPEIQAQRAQPTWSNDGTRVVWTSLNAEGPSVTIADFNGDNRVTISAPTPAFFFAWSPDDSTIAALGPSPQGVELFFVDTAAGAITRVGSGQPFFVDWASDTSLTSAVNGAILADIPTDGVTVDERELSAPLGAFQAPANVDDLILVAIASGFDGNDLALIDGNDAVTVALAPGPITFSPNPVDTRVAVLVNADTSESQVIAFQPESPATLPPNRVSIVDFVTGEVETLDIEGALATQWSPNGAVLAVLLAQETGLEWRFVIDDEMLPGDPFIPSQEFFNSYVPFADQYERSATWWSPDSRAVVFSGSIDGESGVWVDLVEDGRAAIRIADGDIAFFSPAS